MGDRVHYVFNVRKVGTVWHKNGEMHEFEAKVDMQPTKIALRTPMADSPADLDYPTEVTVKFAMTKSQIRGEGQDVELQEASTAARKVINALHRSFYPEMHGRRRGREDD